MHGGIIPIIATDARGKIVARSIVRLGWDKVNDRPVLLQEKIYSSIRDAKLTQLMNEMVLRKAESMGIPLLGERGSSPHKYPGTFSYLGGDFPFVQSDAARGISDGINGFDITDCALLSHMHQ